MEPDLAHTDDPLRRRRRRGLPWVITCTLAVVLVACGSVPATSGPVADGTGRSERGATGSGADGAPAGQDGGHPTASMRGVSLHAPWLEPEGGAVAASCDGGFGLTEVWNPDDGAYPGDPCGVTSPTVDYSPAVVLTAPGLMLPAPTGTTAVTVDGQPAVRTDRVDPATGATYLVSVVLPGNGVELLIRPDQTDVDRVLAATRVTPAPVDPATSSVRVVPVPGGPSLLVATADLSEPRRGGFVPGRLGVVDGGCVGLDREGYGELVVWPRGTTALPDGTGIEAPGLGVVRFGDELALSSSTRYVAALDPGSGALDDVPSGCLDGVVSFGLVEREQPYQDGVVGSEG